MITLKINKDYKVPKCYKHKIYCDIAVTTSKKYPRKVVMYCHKCAIDLRKKDKMPYFWDERIEYP